MTITASQEETFQAELEDWRETMIDLAKSSYLSFDLSEDTLAIIANSLTDVRVRDTLIWHISPLDDEGLSCAISYLLSIWEMGYRQCQTVEVATLIALTSYIAGSPNLALLWSNRALAMNPEYSLAMLVSLSCSINLDPAAVRSVFDGLSYEEVRYGRNN